MTDPTLSKAPTSPQSSASTSDTETYLTWSNFFSILTNSATPQLRQSYFDERDILNEDKDCARCEESVKWLFKASPIITFMKHNIDLLTPKDEHGVSKATIGPHNVRCRRCTTRQSGGFDPEYGILLCANHFRNRGHLEDTLAHEMVHVYDHLRFKLDPLDLRHAACMEIRAMTLSGECRFSREFFTRGRWNLTQQLQECVRRRAALSVAQRPACKDDVHAVRVVNEVWESCFNDTRPFDEIYK